MYQSLCQEDWYSSIFILRRYSNLSLEGYQTIDIGHVYSEYEWFKMGAAHKVKLNHKHMAEHNYD